MLHTNSFTMETVSPAKRLGMPVVESDIGHDFADQVGDQTEDAMADAVAGDHPQRDFELIELGGMGWSEVEMRFGIVVEPIPHEGSFMNRRVVQDYLDYLPPVRSHGFIEKPHKFLSGLLRGI